MTTKQWLIVSTLILSLGNFLVRATMPPTPVTVTVSGGDESFFNARLSGVPSGYEVANGTYAAWCIEMFSTNDPTINGGVHSGLIAGAQTPNLPAPFADLPWDRINYLLNHQQGTPTDIQYALWHFTDGFNPDPTANPMAIAMIQDTTLNGAGFLPQPGDVTAAAVVWVGADSQVQHIIIEVPPAVMPECADRFTAGGFIFNNRSKVTFGIQGGVQNGRLWGGINFVDHGLRLHVQSRSITSYLVLGPNCRQATYAVSINGTPATATVNICDQGEPGRNDIMEITISNGYSVGAGTTLGGNGKGGGNVQLHKPRCNETKPKKPRGNAR
jgi:hypothetical protein